MLAVQALLAAAERERRIDRVEDELFRFERIVAGDKALLDTLSSRNTDGSGKATLVHGLLEGKVAPETTRLVEQAVRVPRGRRLDQVLESYLKLAAQRRDELTALVTVAAPLSEQQHARLRSALEAHYSKAVSLQVVEDPAVMGGIRVQVGDEVVDGTVLRRLDEARRHVTGG
jgi:F-type H+-transporting ATPase subunit delta